MSADKCSYFEDDQGCVSTCGYYYDWAVDGANIKHCVDKCSSFSEQNFFIEETNKNNHCLGSACPSDKFYYVLDADSTKCLEKCDNSHPYANQRTGQCLAQCKIFTEVESQGQNS